MRRLASNLELVTLFIVSVLLSCGSHGAVPLVHLNFDSEDLPACVSMVGEAPVYIAGRTNGAVELTGSTGFATKIGIEQLAGGTTWMAWVKPYKNEKRKQLISIDDGAFDWTIGVEDGFWNVFSGGRRHVTKLRAELNEWQFVFVQYDPVFSRIVVGVDDQYQVIHDLNVPMTRFDLGVGYNPGFGEYFEGAIEEVRIYGEVLNLSEVEALAAELSPFRQIAEVEGAYRVLYVRVSFPDTNIVYEGDQSEIEAVLSRVSKEVKQATFGKVTIESEVANEIYALSKGASYYGGDQITPIRVKELTLDVHRAIAGDYDPESYDLVGVILGYITENDFPGTSWRYGGGDAGTFCDVDGCLPFNILRSVNDITVYHEFGHNLGLGHSSLWIPEDANVPDGPGEKLLYGYPFDIMGGIGNDISSLPEFNHVFKYHAGWLPQRHVSFANSSGVFTLRPYDEDNSQGIMSIIIPATAGVSYHLGFRDDSLLPTETPLGVEIMRVESDDRTNPSIIDTSPHSELNALDAPLSIGKTFSFSSIPVNVTPLRRFRDDQGAAIVVRVQYADELPTLASHPADLSVVEGETASFSVIATEPEGLAYEWQYSTSCITNWQSIPGADTSLYQIRSSSLPLDGNLYRVLVSNNFGMAASNAARLSVSVGANLPGWARDSQEIDNGWRYFDWFKGFKPGPSPSKWIYHGRHGWQYVLGESTSSLSLWDTGVERWFWTNGSVYPWMYVYGPNQGWLYFFEGGRPGSRWFRRGDNGDLVSEGQLRNP